MPDTPLTINVWFESILAPTRTRNWAGKRLGYVPLAIVNNITKSILPSSKFGASGVGSRGFLLSTGRGKTLAMGRPALARQVD